VVELVSPCIEDIAVYKPSYSENMSSITKLPKRPCIDIAPGDRGEHITYPDGIVLKMAFDVFSIPVVISVNDWFHAIVLLQLGKKYLDLTEHH
jgi:hypothetical protein